jgi:hypothetical protein
MYARDASQVDGNHEARRQFWPNQKQHGHNGNQKSSSPDAGLGRSIQYYDDIYNTSQSP